MCGCLRVRACVCVYVRVSVYETTLGKSRNPGEVVQIEDGDTDGEEVSSSLTYTGVNGVDTNSS